MCVQRARGDVRRRAPDALANVSAREQSSDVTQEQDRQIEVLAGQFHDTAAAKQSSHLAVHMVGAQLQRLRLPAVVLRASGQGFHARDEFPVMHWLDHEGIGPLAECSHHVLFEVTCAGEQNRHARLAARADPPERFSATVLFAVPVQHQYVEAVLLQGAEESIGAVAMTSEVPGALQRVAYELRLRAVSLHYHYTQGSGAWGPWLEHRDGQSSSFGELSLVDALYCA